MCPRGPYIISAGVQGIIWERSLFKKKNTVQGHHSLCHVPSKLEWLCYQLSYCWYGSKWGLFKRGWEVRISRGDQEKIMWNFQGSILVFGLGVFKNFKLNFTPTHILSGQYQAGIELTNFKWFVGKKSVKDAKALCNKKLNILCEHSQCKYLFQYFY